jgi:hypothetical protein
MGDILVKGMGVLDIITGGLIMFAFDFKVFALILGVLMIGKGGMSLAG